MALFQNRLTRDILSLKRSYEQGVFLKRLGTLLEEGFSLKDALAFLSTIANKEKKSWINSIQLGLEKGNMLHEELKKINFSDRTCAQLYFSLVHGSFHEMVRISGQQLIDHTQKKKKLLQIVHYPLILLVFMISMLFAMRYILLPHIRQIANPEVSTMDRITQTILFIVYNSPYWLIGLLLTVLLICLVLKIRLHKKTVFERIQFYSKLPFLKSYLQLYWTQFYSFEWGQLMKSGCSMREIIHIMQAKDASIFLQEAGERIDTEMNKGKTFQESLESFTFLKSEVREIISHGETSGRLGSEMMLFSIECEEELNQRIERLMERIQPVVFIFVALMIIAIYAALLLPTFSLMEGL